MALIRCECGSVHDSAHPACPGCGRCPTCGRNRLTKADLETKCPACGSVQCDTCGRCHGCGATRLAGIGPCECGFPTSEKVAPLEQSSGPAKPHAAGCLILVAAAVAVGVVAKSFL